MKALLHLVNPTLSLKVINVDKEKALASIRIAGGDPNRFVVIGNVVVKASHLCFVEFGEDDADGD